MLANLGERVSSARLRRRYRLLKWRALARLPFLSRGGVVQTEVQGHRMYLDLFDTIHCEILYTDGIWERQETDFIRSRIRKGMVIVDIGANVGY